MVLINRDVLHTINFVDKEKEKVRNKNIKVTKEKKKKKGKKNFFVSSYLWATFVGKLAKSKSNSK